LKSVIASLDDESLKSPITATKWRASQNSGGKTIMQKEQNVETKL
jgi:hypothetical protein